MKRQDYIEFDALGLADLARRGVVSADDILEAAYSQIEALNPHVNAVIDLFERPGEALGSADAVFAGVPFLMKDIGSGVLGKRTVAASRYLMNAPVVSIEDELTTRFRSAGLRILGKSNLPELGFNVTTEPLLHGPCRNPWNLQRTPGGSSGGAAAAVAAGMVPIAHAGDGAGSIRIPAACCGLVGLKPSRGLLPQGPHHSDVYGGLVSEGVISRSVRDTAAAIEACRGEDLGAPYASPRDGDGLALLKALQAPGPRLRICTAYRCAADVSLSKDAVAAVQEAAKKLADLGHLIVENELPLSDEDFLVPRQVYLAHVCAQAAADREEDLAVLGHYPRQGEMEPINLAAATRGRAISAVDFLRIIRRGHAFTRKFARVWQSFDIILTPALAEPPPLLGCFPTDHDDVDLHVARMTRFAPFAGMFNVTGDPAIVLPVSLNANGLPLAVQLVARLGRDRDLLVLAAELEANTGPGDFPRARLAPLAYP
jgi:amidase